MIQESDRVVLTTDLPEYHLRSGDIGTVVLIHDVPGYEIEFETQDGETVAVVSVNPNQIRPVARGEIAHARPVEAV